MGRSLALEFTVLVEEFVTAVDIGEAVGVVHPSLRGSQVVERPIGSERFCHSPLIKGKAEAKGNGTERPSRLYWAKRAAYVIIGP